MAKEAEEENDGDETTTSTVEEEEKAESLDKYKDVLEAVYALKEMTDTAMWQAFYGRIMKHIDRHAKDMLEAEKTREIIQHQEGVKIMRALIEEVREPIDELSVFIRSMPLYAADMKIHAEWNSALGKVELRDRS